MPILAAYSNPSPAPNRFQVAADVLYSLPALTIAERTQKALTPKQQAKLIGITPATLARMEAPGSKPTGATLLALLRYFGGLNG